MSSSNNRNILSSLIPAFFILIVGAVGIFISSLKTENVSVVNGRENIKAYITDVDQSKNPYDVKISYTYQNYIATNVSLGYYQDGMKVGDTVYIFVEPSNPSDFTWSEKELAIVRNIGNTMAIAGFGGSLLYTVHALIKKCS